MTDEIGGAAPGYYENLPGPPSSYFPDDSESTDPYDRQDDRGGLLPPYVYVRPKPLPVFPDPPTDDWEPTTPGWQPPTIGQWTPPYVPAPDIAPGDRILPWLPPSTPADPDPGVDLWPGRGEPPDVTAPFDKAFDMAAMLPMMIMMMIMKN